MTKTTKKKPYKRLTIAEKKFRKKLREDLRDKGLIPPVKTRLNRKKFLAEVKEEFKTLNYADISYLYEAISWMLAGTQANITSEQIGVLKTMKLSVDIKKYMEEIKKKGETSYNQLELYQQVVDPIIKL